MTVTGATIRDALAAVGAVGKQLRGFDELAAGADGALRQAPPGLTAAGAASWLATQAQESAYFRTTEEYRGAQASYAPYFGRTFDQLTWRDAYAGFGAWCRGHGLVDNADVFVNDPAALADYRWAWLGGVYYFEAHGLWAYANRGDHLAVSQGVNGGAKRIGTSFTPNGWRERSAMFDAFRRAGDALLPAGGAPAAGGGGFDGCRYGDHNDPDTRTWQGYLRGNFAAYAGGLVVDGDYGDATKRATAEFQRRAGVTGPDADGSTVGPRTITAARGLGFRG